MIRRCFFAMSYLITLIFLGLITPETRAGIVFSDNFDSGTSTATASMYYSNTSIENDLILKTTAGTDFGNAITSDASGSGYFLFEGTNGTDTPPPPPDQNAFYINSFAVAANTDYVLSFALENATTPNQASIQAQINGVTLGTPVSAVGSSNGFQTFSFTFNSGTATSATLTLNDLQTIGSNGNDFALDNVLVATPTPEPSTIAYLVSGGLVALVAARVQRNWAAV